MHLLRSTVLNTALLALILFVRGNAATPSVQAWLTTADFSNKLARQPDLAFDSTAASGTAIDVNTAATFQTMDGFGLSLTDTSAWLLSHQLTTAKHVDVMESLFGPTGIHMSMVRQVMGTSDFATETYSYDDGAVDTALTRFSIAKDKRYLLPVLKEAIALSGDFKVMASPWSPPGWMKTSNSMIGGTLVPAYRSAYADYFVKFIKAYEAEGVPIYAVTPQNEPGYSPGNYPGMFMSALEQTTFIKSHLGPALKAAGVSTKLICFDHNYDAYSTPLSILADTDAAAFVAGSAFHHYGGQPSSMTTLHGFFPAKDIWFTEGGIGDWNDTFDNLVHEMVSIPRNWAKSIIFWNAALDHKDGPALIGDNNTNQGMVTIRSDGLDQVTYNAQYYYMGHTSKFVRPGAVRIESTNRDGQIETVAYQNPDGSKALVVFNKYLSAQTVRITQGNRSFHHTLPQHSLMTFVWDIPVAPTIVTPPASTSLAAGSPLTLSVAATGDTPTYLWRHSGIPIAGATSSTFTLPSTSALDAGLYDVVVSNQVGSVVSPGALVTLTGLPASDARLYNISTRALSGAGDNRINAGFAVRGGTTKRVLIRAAGPALDPFGISNLLPNPSISLIDLSSGNTVVASNDDWTTDLAPIFAQAGAFAWPTGSKDAALVATLNPGNNYSAVVTGLDAPDGVSIVEIYELDTNDASAGRLYNISTRSLVGTDSNAQIAGFVILGTAPKKVVIRAAGPSLGAFGVAGALEDPVLSVQQLVGPGNAPLVATNDNWDAALAPDFTAAGAFAWTPGSKDAAVVVTLNPGNYSATVTGQNGTTGVALVEVYEGASGH